MPSPALRLRPGGPADVEDMCETVLDAFSGNTVGRTFFPATSASARRFWLGALADEVLDPGARFVVVEDTVASPPALVAFAKWIAPLPPGTPQPPLPGWWPGGRGPGARGGLLREAGGIPRGDHGRQAALVPGDDCDEGAVPGAGGWWDVDGVGCREGG